jgi:hypothetical protein
MPSIRPAHRRGLATLALTLLTHAVTATGNALHPITPDDLRPHIRILASDAFEGRKAGGSGQEKAIHYIAQQMRKAGLQPGATGGTWYQPVNIVHLIPQQADAFWSIGGKRIDVAPDAIALNGPAGTASIHNGHLVFVGYGLEERVITISTGPIFVERSRYRHWRGRTGHAGSEGLCRPSYRSA